MLFLLLARFSFFFRYHLYCFTFDRAFMLTDAASVAQRGVHGRPGQRDLFPPAVDNLNFTGKNGLRRDGTDFLALRLVVMADTLSAQVGIDLVDFLALRNGAVGALRLTHVAIDAFIGNHEGHTVP